MLRESFQNALKIFEFNIIAICVMKNHLHMILKLKNIKEYPKIIYSIKFYFSYRLNKNNKISESKLKNEKYILSYVLDKSEELSNKISAFAKEKALPILEIEKEDCSIQDWLYLIKNAEYIITDSYHGLCFSLIFNKNVKCVANISRGAERFVSLQKLLNFPDDIFMTDEIEAINFEDIDYSKINKYIEINKQKCIEHLAFVMKIKKEIDEEAKKRDIKLQKKYSKNISGFKRFKYKVEKILYKILYKLFKKQKFYEKYETYKARLK